MRKHKKEQVHLVPVHATYGDTGTQRAPDRQRRAWKTVAIIAVLAAVGAAWVAAGLDAATDETG